ncbi:MAG: DsrE family protein [Candidatus Lokiarchaeota archaeon]|nr:DsrE family protein [Candidatus Lokiarchaeota archaeon]
MVESVIIICNKSPIGKNSAIEVIRLGSGFMGLGEELDCKIVFTGDSVYMLNKQADPRATGGDSYEETLEMADLSDLELKVLDTALEEVGLSKVDLIDYENLSVISMRDLKGFIDDASSCFYM